MERAGASNVSSVMLNIRIGSDLERLVMAKFLLQSLHFRAEIVAEPRNGRDYRRSSVTFERDTVCMQIRGLTVCTSVSRRTALK